MTRRPVLLLLLALPAAALPACGGDAPAGRVRDGRVAVAIEDFRYRPQLIRAAPGRMTKVARVRKGDYRFFCALSNHEELGMYGTLVVR
jgi:plastocyanin